MLDFGSVVEKFLTLTLLRARPIARLAVVHPGALQVFGGAVFHKSRTLSIAKVPHRINVHVFGQVLGQMVAVARENVDHTPREVGSLENLVQIDRRQFEDRMAYKNSIWTQAGLEGTCRESGAKLYGMAEK